MKDFETIAREIKEQRTALFIAETELCAVAVDGRAERWLAGLWGVSTHYIRTLARIFHAFPPEDILPDVPLPLYRAALDTDEPLAWLWRALDEGWSPRQLRDHAGIAKGKRLSSTIFQGYDVAVTEWDVPTGRFTAEGLPLSGEKPKRARVTVREVFHNETPK